MTLVVRSEVDRMVRRMEICSDSTVTHFRMTPRGPFDLAHQNRYFGGWPTLTVDPRTVVMASPVYEAWDTSWTGDRCARIPTSVAHPDRSLPS